VLGVRITAARKACGFRQSELAEAVGHTQHWVWNIEHGQNQGGCCDVTLMGLLVGLPPEKLYAK
jgi:transcriptional regulator with XRE-family HTH domain